MKKLFYVFTCCFFICSVSCEDKTKFLDNKTNPNEQNESNIGTSVTAPKPEMFANHEAIDLGLPSGLLWSTCNLGALYPEEIGYYYAWGETSMKDTYTEENYKFMKSEDSYYVITKYCIDAADGKVDNRKVLDLSDDAANANWGSNWRMPTREDFEELRVNCTWENDYKNHVYKAIGPNGNSIIFPATGAKDKSLYNKEVHYYWTSSLNLHQPSGYCSWCADCFNFYDIRIGSPDDNFSERTIGCPIRPVFKKK